MKQTKKKQVSANLAVSAKAPSAKSQKRAGKAMRGPVQTGVAAAYSSAASSGKAQVYRSSVDSCRMKHRELIGSVVGTSAFTATTFSINPGLSSTFPWLSVEAAGWEKYKFHSLRFCYYTRTGTNVPGSVQMVIDYDAADAAPISEQIASAYFGTQEDAVWKDIVLVADMRRLAEPKFLRSGTLASNLDIKTYDVGNFYLTTLDGTAVNWGKVWVEYDVELINPQLPSSGAPGSGALVSGGGSIAAATPFGSVPVATGSYGLNCSATNVLSWSGLTVGQEYMLTISYAGTVISATSVGTGVGLTTKTNAFEGFNTAATLAASNVSFVATLASGSYTLSLTATTITQGFAVLSALTVTPSL